MKERLKHYLDKLKEYGGSDLHLSAGAKIHIRINADLHILGNEKLTNEEMMLLYATSPAIYFLLMNYIFLLL